MRHGPWRTRRLRELEHFAITVQARRAIAAWVEQYHQERRHSSIGMISPVDYEQALAAGQKEAA